MSSLSDVNLTAPKRRSLYRRILVALLVVFMLGFGNIAVHLYGTRDELRRVVLSLQARAVSEGLRSDSDLSTLPRDYAGRSEEHTSELQSRENLVCRLLLEKKKIHGKP